MRFVFGSRTSKKCVPRFVSSRRRVRLPAHGPSSVAPAPATAKTSPFGPPVWKRSSRIVRRVNAASKAAGEETEEREEEFSANRKRERAANGKRRRRAMAACRRLRMPPSYIRRNLRARSARPLLNLLFQPLVEERHHSFHRLLVVRVREPVTLALQDDERDGDTGARQLRREPPGLFDRDERVLAAVKEEEGGCFPRHVVD